jgi:hypothetical protein
MLADALLRSVSGTSAQLRVTGNTAGTNQSEVGLITTAFTQVVVSPVVMRKLRPTLKDGDTAKWELLVSASSVQAQVDALDLASAQSLFSMTLAIKVAGQDYLLESLSSSEAFGQVYLYRLMLREARAQAL